MRKVWRKVYQISLYLPSKWQNFVVSISDLSIYPSNRYYNLLYIYVFNLSEKATAPHSSTLAWKIPWTEEPGGLQSMGSLRVGHDWATSLSLHFHALEKEMATHSSVLAWRIPGTGEPGGLPSMGSHTVGHDWSDLAAFNLYVCIIYITIINI